MPTLSKSKWLRLLSVFAMLFGLITLVKSGSILFGPKSAAESVGAIVPFVIWFNFAAGFIYLLAAWGIWRATQWAVWLSAAIALATLVVGGLFALYVSNGGAFSMQTVAALPLRAGIWVLITAMLFRARVQ